MAALQKQIWLFEANFYLCHYGNSEIVSLMSNVSVLQGSEEH